MTSFFFQPDAGIDAWVLLLGLFGGLAIFLHGMDGLSESLRLMAGGRLRRLLVRLTDNRFFGALTGAGVTAVIQSSSVTTVLVVGFVSSGLMTLAQAIGVILGANVGTTITAQIIAFKVTDYALAAVAVGFALSLIGRSPSTKARGQALLGLGLVFFGMGLMGDAMRPLRTYEPFMDLMASLSNPLLGIAVGALFTALVQSSSATTSIVIVLAAEGLIGLDAGIALVLGANVGTSATALLAAVAKPRTALRAAYAHTFFNIIGVVLWLPFVGLLADWVMATSTDTARQVANAHSIFNIVNATIFLGFTSQLASLVTRLAPDRDPAEEARIVAKYLDRGLLQTPGLALDRARLEMLRMASRISTMLDLILPAVLSGDRGVLLEIEQMDDEIDDLHGHIITYLGEVSKQKLSQDDGEEILALLSVVNDLEAIGDIIETNLVALGISRLDEHLEVSAATAGVLREFHGLISDAFGDAMLAVTQKNSDAARRVLAMKKTINGMERSAISHEADRLVADQANRVSLYRLETDIIANLKRIYYFTRRVARQAVPTNEQARS